MLGGGLFMNKNSGDWSERHREDIEENVRNYVERYKLDPEKVEIERIHNPKKYPTGEEEFMVYIYYHGEPYFSMSLTGDPKSLSIYDRNDYIVVKVFNELYLQARYEEFKPAIEYLDNLNVQDPLRPTENKVRFLQTSVGLASEINESLKKAYYSEDDLTGLKKYINENLEIISELDRVEIIGNIEGLKEERIDEISKDLKQILPSSDYYLQIGEKNLATGESQGIFEYITIE
jgi:hypothetical protein